MNEIKTHVDELQNLVFENRKKLDDDNYKKIIEKISLINSNVTRKINVKRFTLQTPCIKNWGQITEEDPLNLGFSERIVLLARDDYDNLVSVIKYDDVDNKTEFEDLKVGDAIIFTSDEIPYLCDKGDDEVTVKYNHNRDDYYMNTIHTIITKIENIGYNYAVTY